MITSTLIQNQKTKGTVHKSVLLEAVLEGLDIKENDIVLDGTLGGAGHSLEMARRLGKGGVLIGIDQDSNVLEHARAILAHATTSVLLIQGNFRIVDQIIGQQKFEKVDKILLDLGFSSDQLDNSGRGFSFLKDEPLLMTLSSDSSADRFTARDIINDWEEENIATIIKEYGEESFAKKIAKAVVVARMVKPIERTFELVEIIKSATPGWYHHRQSHPATKTFQALRITVNDEIEAHKEGLENGFKILNQNGLMAVISFHSLEDRLVKHYFREQSLVELGKVITKRPIIPERDEIMENPRSRSAKLRIIQKL
jgi:16S rRNA (cytosine1402-N4)-methyltransferase